MRDREDGTKPLLVHIGGSHVVTRRHLEPAHMLFSGGRDGSFYALDARTGKLLWQTNLGPSVASSPITYAINGKQYVSVMAGNSLFTFGLRER